jgi:cytochrome c-type biogenesis protein CcmF
MNYIGEHLLPGQIGHFFGLLFMVSSVLATIAYCVANFTKSIPDKQSWQRLARIAAPRRRSYCKVHHDNP